MQKFLNKVTYIVCAISLFCAVKKIFDASKASVNAFKAITLCKKI